MTTLNFLLKSIKRRVENLFTLTIVFFLQVQILGLGLCVGQHTRVVLASFMLSPFRCKQCIALLNYTLRGRVQQAHLCHSSCTTTCKSCDCHFNLKRAIGDFWFAICHVHCSFNLLELWEASNNNAHRCTRIHFTRLKNALPRFAKCGQWF